MYLCVPKKSIKKYLQFPTFASQKKKCLLTMKTARVILRPEQLNLVLERLCYQLIEDYDDFKDVYIIGIQTGGVRLATYLLDRLTQITGKPKSDFPFGKLDITFYRDDFRTRKKPLSAHAMEMPFIIEDKKVILIDDVVYSGRSVQAAMTALTHYGRPSSVRLLTMVDRRFHREIPVRPDYFGVVVDALDDAYVRIERIGAGFQLVLDIKKQQHDTI
jgi:pyrimidine operon attenuation protein / uracil phosphoribosyltransferase